MYGSTTAATARRVLHANACATRTVQDSRTVQDLRNVQDLRTVQDLRNVRVGAPMRKSVGE